MKFPVNLNQDEVYQTMKEMLRSINDRKLQKSLKTTMLYTSHNVKNEMFYPFSMKNRITENAHDTYSIIILS